MTYSAPGAARIHSATHRRSAPVRLSLQARLQDRGHSAVRASTAHVPVILSVKEGLSDRYKRALAKDGAASFPNRKQALSSTCFARLPAAALRELIEVRGQR